MSNPYAPTDAPLKQAPAENTTRRLPFNGWWPVGFGALAGMALRLVFWGKAGNAYSAMLDSFILGLADRRWTRDRELWVAAPVERVWWEIIDTRDIRPDEVDAWMYRIGVPKPHAGTGDFRGGEHLRHITMGEGIRFEQIATQWRENQRVTWRYRFDSDSFPPGALDEHVRIGGEYFDLGETTYSLEPAAGGTLLRIEMRYRVSTHFNWYAGPVADFLVGDFAEHILGFYAQRASVARAGAQPAS